MNNLLIIIWIWLAFIAMALWESSVEGRNVWDRKKIGWKINFSKNFSLTKYHFWLIWIMLPMFTLLPLIINWDWRLFGLLLSGFASGLVIEDFTWYLVNPKVKFKEWFTNFSDYYPWIKIKGRKIIPLLYLIGVAVAILSKIIIWN